DEMTDVLASVIGQILERANELVSIDDDSLIVMGAYTRIYSEWTPGSIDAPRLLIRAGEPLGEASDLPEWQQPEDVVEVEGDHWALIEDAAAETAKVAEAWLAEKIA